MIKNRIGMMPTLAVLMVMMLAFDLMAQEVGRTHRMMADAYYFKDLKLELVFCLRVIVAFMLGGFVGICHDGKWFGAGAKIFSAVALGAATFSGVAVHAYMYFNEPGALGILSGVMSGAGFLAAAVIFQKEASVQGLTTSATLWTCASIGIACSYSMFVIAVLSSALISLYLHLFRACADSFEIKPVKKQGGVL